MKAKANGIEVNYELHGSEDAPWPGTLDITTASLDEPERFPPTHHSWLGDDLGWVKFGDGLPVFQKSRSK